MNTNDTKTNNKPLSLLSLMVRFVISTLLAPLLERGKDMTTIGQRAYCLSGFVNVMTQEAIHDTDPM